jgi:hypothetical protein
VAVAVGLIALSGCRADGAQDRGAGDRSGPTDVVVTSTAPTTSEPPRPTTTVVSTTATTAAGAGIEPADSPLPAAGICGQASGAVGNVVMGTPDNVPEPRCLIVRGDQRLSVTNQSSARLDVAIGARHKAVVAPNETYVFPGTVATFLARGVHRLVSASSTAEIWVDPVCTGPGGGPPCSTP